MAGPPPRTGRDHIDAGHHLEQFAREMRRASGAARGHAELARAGFGICNQLGNRTRLNQGHD